MRRSGDTRVADEIEDELLDRVEDEPVVDIDRRIGVPAKVLRSLAREVAQPDFLRATTARRINHTFTLSSSARRIVI